MATDEQLALTRALSGDGGLGVEESTLVSIIGKWRKKPEHISSFRKSFNRLFSITGHIEKCEDDHMQKLVMEFSRFHQITVLWAMHPHERDARWANQVIHKNHPSSILVEIASTRSAEELLGARRAYQTLFHHSLEEDVAYQVKDSKSKLLVGLVSAYRYEGQKVDNDVAKSEAKALHNALKTAGANKIIENDEVVRILSTRSKPHLKAVFKYYKELHGKYLEEDLSGDALLQQTVLCLDSPASYFSQVINSAFKEGANHAETEGLSRVMVSRSDVDMEEIKEAYAKLYGAKLADVISKKTRGYFRDSLLSLAGEAKA
ncbi:Annexin [Rhynchospora pubera]|uniref:Annexin n=1 Tax=Rhynchospora pubera TaxID=906938 RepID=A0AAV8EGD0_9POAL|nr:Annexin [Rhynchospora pubera]KAJ4779494.1 Annexin [Rhynchospora pubera]